MEEKEPNIPEVETEAKVDSTLQNEENNPLVNQSQEIREEMDDSISSDQTNNSEPSKKNDSIKNIERLLDVEMNVTVRFGKTEIPLREAVNFGIGSMIELNRSVDEPVDLLVNNFPFARGEVVVIDGYYGVRVTEIGTPEERSNALLKNAS